MRKIVVILVGLLTLATARGATAETLKVAVAQRGFWNSSFVEFARAQGFFKAEGLDIEILEALEHDPLGRHAQAGRLSAEAAA